MFRDIQIVIITNFVVVSCVGIKRVDCTEVTECMNGEQMPRRYFVQVQDDRMFEDTFLVDTAHL